jgi:hypothetical protein
MNEDSGEFINLTFGALKRGETLAHSESRKHERRKKMFAIDPFRVFVLSCFRDSSGQLEFIHRAFGETIAYPKARSTKTAFFFGPFRVFVFSSFVIQIEVTGGVRIRLNVGESALTPSHV